MYHCSICDAKGAEDEHLKACPLNDSPTGTLVVPERGSTCIVCGGTWFIRYVDGQKDEGCKNPLCENHLVWGEKRFVMIYGQASFDPDRPRSEHTVHGTLPELCDIWEGYREKMKEASGSIYRDAYEETPDGSIGPWINPF